MQLTRLRAFAMPLFAVCLLSACASDTTETTSPTASPSKPPATATSAPPSRTATATKSAQGVPALSTVMPAITAYFDEYNKAMATSSTTKFRKTFDKGCINCQKEAGRLEATFAKGQKYRGGELVFSCAKVEKGIGGSLSHVIATCSVHQRAWQLLDEGGSQADSAAASKPLAVYVQVARKGPDKALLVTGIAA